MIRKQKILTISLASWGIMLIGSGSIMQTMVKPIVKNKPQTIDVKLRKIENEKSNEIKLKDIEIEINHPLSLNIKDYLQSPSEIENKVLSKLKLDTSSVNINQAGTYKYVITYKQKKYNGQIVIKEKQTPIMEALTLKNPSIETNSVLSTNVQDYVNETIPAELINSIKLDLTNVNAVKAGSYQYTITYNGKMYTGTITVYEPQKTETVIGTAKIVDNKKEEKANTQQQPQSQKTETTTPTQPTTTTETP